MSESNVPQPEREALPFPFPSDPHFDALYTEYANAYSDRVALRLFHDGLLARVADEFGLVRQPRGRFPMVSLQQIVRELQAIEQRLAAKGLLKDVTRLRQQRQALAALSPHEHTDPAPGPRSDQGGPAKKGRA